MMTTAPVSPPAASTAPAESPTGADPALAGLFGEELAQLLLEEQGGDDDEALAPEALALLLAAVVEAPPASSAAPAAADADSPMGGVLRRLELHGAPAAPVDSGAEASLDGMLQELRTSTAGSRSLAESPAALTAQAGSTTVQIATTSATDHLAGLVAASGQAADSRPTTQHAALRHELPLQTPVGSHAWGDELASRIATIATDGPQSASVRLSPEHLGPLHIRIAVRDGDAAVTFGASHADTRAALEQSLPRLRELLAAQGLNLAEASVSEHAPREDRAPTPAGRRAVAAGADPVQDAERREARPVGLVDLYA